MKLSQTSYDKDGNLVFLADNGWAINLAKRDFPEVSFYPTSKFNRADLT